MHPPRENMGAQHSRSLYQSWGHTESQRSVQHSERYTHPAVTSSGALGPPKIQATQARGLLCIHSRNHVCSATRSSAHALTVAQRANFQYRGLRATASTCTEQGSSIQSADHLAVGVGTIHLVTRSILTKFKRRRARIRHAHHLPASDSRHCA